MEFNYLVSYTLKLKNVTVRDMYDVPITVVMYRHSNLLGCWAVYVNSVLSQVLVLSEGRISKTL
jgi:hypothetical protein